MKLISSFFDKTYQTPTWLKDKLTAKKQSRRQMLKGALKSAGGASVALSIPFSAWSTSPANLSDKVNDDPWLTLDAVLNHLLPSSATGPGAKEIQATRYLFNIVHKQPTEQDEIDFIYKGVGWLNGYSQSQLKVNFVALTEQEKEKLLRGISQSRAGENWLNTLLGYILEAMLTPPIYGGNTNKVGWQWLEHQGGFPLPAQGTRFYELPSPQTNSTRINISIMPNNTRAFAVVAQNKIAAAKGRKA